MIAKTGKCGLDNDTATVRSVCENTEQQTARPDKIIAGKRLNIIKAACGLNTTAMGRLHEKSYTDWEDTWPAGNVDRSKSNSQNRMEATVKIQF